MLLDIAAVVDLINYKNACHDNDCENRSDYRNDFFGSALFAVIFVELLTH